MIRKMVLPLLAAAMMSYAVLHVLRASPTVVPSYDLPEPRGHSGIDTIAASGIVEAQTENIAVGSPVAGIVTQVRVGAGAQVKVGDALFRLDDRELVAELKCQQANLQAAQVRLTRLQHQPRLEELPPAEAQVREAEAILRREKDVLERERRLAVVGAASAESLHRREQDFQAANERLAQAKADLRLLKAGAWKYDLEVARAAVAQSQSQLERVKTQLERLTVCARIEGEVLRVDIRPGEYVGTPPGRPLILLGNIHPLHVRVSIDEQESARFRIGAAARARLKGTSQVEFVLHFVRMEPFVVPKPALTGASSERTDTRVLQAIYAVEPHREPLYVGQQLDVFVDACH